MNSTKSQQPALCKQYQSVSFTEMSRHLCHSEQLPLSYKTVLMCKQRINCREKEIQRLSFFNRRLMCLPILRGWLFCSCDFFKTWKRFRSEYHALCHLLHLNSHSDDFTKCHYLLVSKKKCNHFNFVIYRHRKLYFC